MISIPYSRSFQPPAPVVSVLIGPPDASRPPLSVSAQLDTGADRTVIPTSVAHQLGLVPGGHLQFGVVGAVITLPVYFVSLGIPGVMDFIIDVAGDDDEPCILLGRDVLNALHAHLDGPGRMLTLSAHPLAATP